MKKIIFILFTFSFGLNNISIGQNSDELTKGILKQLFNVVVPCVDCELTITGSFSEDNGKIVADVWTTMPLSYFEVETTDLGYMRIKFREICDTANYRKIDLVAVITEQRTDTLDASVYRIKGSKYGEFHIIGKNCKKGKFTFFDLEKKSDGLYISDQKIIKFIFYRGQ